MAYLVIDYGTSGCRASLVSRKGEIVCQKRHNSSLDTSSLFKGEIEVEKVWHHVKEVTSSLIEESSCCEIEAIGVSAMLGYVFLDESNRPLMPATLWMDNRAWKEAEELSALFGEDQLYLLTGRRMSPELLAPKLLWLRRQRPEIFSRIRTIVGLKDELVRRLTGRCVTDYAHLDYTSLWDIRQCRPLEEIMDVLQVRRTWFPIAGPSFAIAGNVVSSAEKEIGLTEGIPVIVGTSDGTAAMYGGGVLQEGKAVLVSGTTDVLMMRSDQYPTDEHRALSVNRGMLQDLFLVGGAMGLSTGAISRLEYLLHESVSELEPRIANVRPGADGLIFCPGLTGERAPYWKAHWTGAVLGLQPWHKPEHIFRALMEGCALRLRSLLKHLERNSLRPKCIHVVGGGGRVHIWNQIRADATGTEIRYLETSEATTLGTAMFCHAAVEGVKVLSDLAREWVKVRSCYAPNPENVKIYERWAHLYAQFFDAVDPLYRQLKEWIASQGIFSGSGLSDVVEAQA